MAGSSGDVDCGVNGDAHGRIDGGIHGGVDGGVDCKASTGTPMAGSTETCIEGIKFTPDLGDVEMMIRSPVICDCRITKFSLDVDDVQDMKPCTCSSRKGNMHELWCANDLIDLSSVLPI